jgi:hypothetical protein
MDESENCRDGKNRHHQRAAVVALPPLLNHRPTAEFQPSGLLDKTDVDRRTNKTGGSRECVQTWPHGAGS